MAVAKAVAAARGFLNASFPSVIFAGWIILPRWQPLGNTQSACSPCTRREMPHHLRARGHVHSCFCPIHIARVPSPSPISTHCWVLPKGPVGHGVQPLPAQPHSCRKTQRNISFGSRQIKYLSVAEAHNKIACKGHPCSPRGLSGILKMKEFLVAPNHHSVLVVLSKNMLWYHIRSSSNTI